MLKRWIASWTFRGNCHAAMSLALDVTDIATCAYGDDAQGLAEFLADVEFARDAVLDLCELVPAHVLPDLDRALDEIDCALTGAGSIDDRLHDMISANAAIKQAHKLTLRTAQPINTHSNVPSRYHRRAPILASGMDPCPGSPSGPP